MDNNVSAEIITELLGLIHGGAVSGFVEELFSLGAEGSVQLLVDKRLTSSSTEL